MKFNLVEATCLINALNRISMGDISLMLRHKIKIYLKGIESHGKAIEENKQALFKKYNIQDIQKEIKEQTSAFKEFDKEFSDYLFKNELELPASDISWDDILRFGNNIVLSPQEDASLKKLFNIEN